jgi:hypothetical protein
MSKQVKPSELAELITGLLVRPDLLGELESSSETHERFIEAIGRVVTEFCGGEVNRVTPADLSPGHKPDLVDTPYLSVFPDISLPSLERCVWSLHDPDGWEDEASSEYDLSQATPYSPEEIDSLRNRLRGLTTEAINAERLAAMDIDTTMKHAITTASEAMKYIDTLAADDLLYHFEDDASDCLSAHNLTESQIEAIEHNVRQLLSVDWAGSGFECPFDYVIAKHP